MSHTVAIFSIFTGLATVAVALRLFTRVRVMRTAGWDDWLIAIALLTDYVFFAFAILETHYALGKSQADLTQSETTKQLKSFYLTIPFYNLTLSFTKLSMLVLYLRLLPMIKYRISVIISLCIIPVVALWMVLSSFMFCVPVEDFWSSASQHRCLPRGVWFLNAALQIVTDLWIVILPMPVLVRLKLPRRQKVAVLLVFGLGIFVCITSIVRIGALAELISHTDNTKYNSPAAIWSSIEANVAIMCSSLPPLRPLVVRLLPPSLRSSRISQQERPVIHPFVAHNNLFHFGNGNDGYSASITAESLRPETQTSLETGRERDSGVGQEWKEGEGGPRSNTSRDTDSGIQVVRELQLDSDLRCSKGEA